MAKYVETRAAHSRAMCPGALVAGSPPRSYKEMDCGLRIEEYAFHEISEESEKGRRFQWYSY